MGLFAGYLGSNVKDFRLVNSYFLGTIYINPESSNCGILIGTFNSSANQGSRVLKSVYTSSKNVGCNVQGTTDRALFGQINPSGLQQAADDGTVTALSSYDRFASSDSQYQHCFDKRGNPLNCHNSNASSSELNFGWSETYWRDNNCQIINNYASTSTQAELISNPQGRCFSQWGLFW